MMLDLGEYREESVNIIAIMGPHGVYHKDEPIKELEAALQRRGFQTIWPQNSADLLQFIEHNPRICGVIFDWDEYSVDLCSDINQLNEYLPLYAFINAHSTMDVSSQDLRMTLWFSNMRWDSRRDRHPHRAVYPRVHGQYHPAVYPRAV